jgi:hypothetical protein
MWIKCFNSVKEFGWVALRACNGEVIHNSRPDPFFSRSRSDGRAGFHREAPRIQIAVMSAVIISKWANEPMDRIPMPSALLSHFLLAQEMRQK